jgi:general secretion pathway protein D
METFKPNYLFRGAIALLATGCLLVPAPGKETRNAKEMADSELSRRSVAVEEARELLRKGDEAYTAARYSDAVEAYSGARDLLPDAPVSAELRAAATDRYALASVEKARVLSRKGDVAAAKATVDKVLVESIAPNHPGALAFRAELDDPIRTNPALTAEHAKNVDSVRRLLYTAQGAYDLGKFDEAKSKYESVLRIDPTNTAARRGLEQVAGARSNYQKAAYDQTRAELLSQVDSQWESAIIPDQIDPLLTAPVNFEAAAEPVSVRNKLTRIIIPKVAMEQASLEEAIDYLRLRCNENDTTELDPALRGVNFTINLGAANSPDATRLRNFRFDLRLTQVPVSQVLKYISDITQTSYTTDSFSVIITPAGSNSPELVSRTYRVPPDFISSLSNGSSPAAPEDPFATAPANKGLLAKRLGAQEALIQQGVSFPEGASASYIPASNTLRVVNTATNLDFISQIIDTLTQTEPVVVSVKVTMITIEETNNQELSFDTVMGTLGFGGPGWVPGSDVLNLSGGTVGNATNLNDIPPIIGAPPVGPITAGNRSGDGAITSDSIDARINDQTGTQVSSRAPGIMRVFGTLDNTTFQTMMRGLDQKKGVSVMTQPSSITRSGQASSIKTTREFIYPSEYEPPQIPNQVGGGFDDGAGGIVGGGGGGNFPVTPATPTAFTMRETGISLEILPVADANKQFVTVTLTPTIVKFDGFVNYGSPINKTQQGLFGPETVVLTANTILMPIFSKQSVNTSVDVADGGTVVLGGLIGERVQNVEDQTPILGSIPILGRFFQSNAKQTTKTAVVFFVNVELMDPTGRRFKSK